MTERPATRSSWSSRCPISRRQPSCSPPRVAAFGFDVALSDSDGLPQQKHYATLSKNGDLFNSPAKFGVMELGPAPEPVTVAPGPPFSPIGPTAFLVAVLGGLLFLWLGRADTVRLGGLSGWLGRLRSVSLRPKLITGRRDRCTHRALWIDRRHDRGRLVRPGGGRETRARRHDPGDRQGGPPREPARAAAARAARAAAVVALGQPGPAAGRVRLHDHPARRGGEAPDPVGRPLPQAGHPGAAQLGHRVPGAPADRGRARHADLLVDPRSRLRGGAEPRRSRRGLPVRPPERRGGRDRAPAVRPARDRIRHGPRPRVPQPGPHGRRRRQDRVPARGRARRRSGHRERAAVRRDPVRRARELAADPDRGAPAGLRRHLPDRGHHPAPAARRWTPSCCLWAWPRAAACPPAPRPSPTATPVC